VVLGAMIAFCRCRLIANFTKGRLMNSDELCFPDLIVVDLRLANNQSGIDAVRQLRDEMGFAIPAIVVSGDTGTRADREARKAGLTLLPKPVVGTTLCAAALTALQRTGRSLETSRLVS
jgi:CheY-like chemotaxis protein